jgi:hypothetical protein
MKTNVGSLKKRAEDLPENFRDFVEIQSMASPFTAIVHPFNDRHAPGFLVTATSAAGKIDIECECPEDGLCDHMAAFFQLLLDIKNGIAKAPEATTPAVTPTPTSKAIADPVQPNVEVERDDEEPIQEAGPMVEIPVTGLAPAILRPEMPVDQLLALQAEMTQLITKALEKDRDYGTIPNTQKPTLLKPGAERIIMAFGAYPEYQVAAETANPDFENQIDGWEDSGHNKPDNWKELKAAGKGRNRQVDGVWQWQVPTGTQIVKGLYEHRVRCILRKRGTNAIIGTGEGSCSSLEKKYESRPRDLQNTILKMAQKRALVAAVLNTFALSDRFTQDVEDQ